MWPVSGTKCRNDWYEIRYTTTVWQRDGGGTAAVRGRDGSGRAAVRQRYGGGTGAVREWGHDVPPVQLTDASTSR